MFSIFFATALHFISPRLAHLFHMREPHIVCHQIGDNRYTCDGYWTD